MLAHLDFSAGKGLHPDCLALTMVHAVPAGEKERGAQEQLLFQTVWILRPVDPGMLGCLEKALRRQGSCADPSVPGR